MQVKRFLWQVRRELLEIKIRREEIEQIRAGLLPCGIRYDMDKVQSSPKDPMSEAVTRIEPLEQQIYAKIRAMAERYTKAYTLVDTLDDPGERQILHLYFLNAECYTMDQVVSTMSYSPRQVYRKYHAALQKLEEKMAVNGSMVP